MRLKELYESKIKLVADLRSIADAVNAEGHEFSVDDDSRFQACKAAIEAAEKKIEVEKTYETYAKHDAVEADRKPKIFKSTADEKQAEITAREQKLAFTGWLSRRRVSDEQSAAMERCGVERGQEEFVVKLGDTECAGELQDRWRNGSAADRAAMLRGNIGAAGMLKGTNTAGGYLVPPGRIASAIDIALLAFGGVRQVSTTIRTDDGSPFNIPTSNDTGNTGELLAEQASIGSTVDATIGQKALGAYKFSSKLCKYSREMQEDSAFDLETFIGKNVGQRIARITNTYFTTGTGSSQPQGVVVGSTAGITAVGTTAVTFDELITLIHTLDPAYWPGASFMFNNATALKLRLLKDGNSHHIWQDDVTDGGVQGFKATLRGFPTTINQDMPAMTTGLKPILFGNFPKFTIRTVGDVRLVQLNELYAATDERAIIGFSREDAILVDAGTHPLIRITMS